MIGPEGVILGTVWKYRYEQMLETAKTWDRLNPDHYAVMRFWVEWAAIDQGPITQHMTYALGEMLEKYGVQSPV